MKCSRRNFVSGLSSLGIAAGLSGCRTSSCDMRASAAIPPYAPLVRDRLWLWGHHEKAFDPPRFTFNAPAGPLAGINDAAKIMGVPNAVVCRYANLPRAEDCAAYFETFTALKRIGFSVVDGARGDWEAKYRLALKLRERHPQLTTIWLDDYFTPQKISRPPDLAAFRRRTAADGFRLAGVIYPDQEGLKDEFREALALLDEVSVWFWHHRSIDDMARPVAQARAIVGPAKSVLLGIYMWGFGEREAVPDARMASQLDCAHRLLHDRTVDGLIFHPSSFAARDISAVRRARRWIARHGNERIG